MRWIDRVSWLAALFAVGAGAPAEGQERRAAAGLERCGGETGERLRFLESRLDGHQRYADLWWKGWTGVYVGGIVVQGARAGFEDDRVSRTSPSTRMLSPTRTGFRHCISSTPGAPIDVARMNKPSTIMRIASAPRCHPLAARPPSIECLAASGSVC